MDEILQNGVINLIQPSGGTGGGAVDSVNGKTGTVVLDAEDVGALPSDTPILPLGSLVTSVTPLSQNSLHLLDGSVLSASDYPDFVDYIAGLYDDNPTADYFCSEADWQQVATAFGMCSKYVYDGVNNTVRLPKVQYVKDTNSGTAPGPAVPWTQPTLSADGTMGGDSPACEASDVYSNYYTWHAFDGNSSTTWCTGSGTKWITFYNPDPLLVSSVELTFKNNEVYANGNISASNDNSTWVQIGSFSGNGSTTVTVTTDPNGVTYKYIRFTGSDVSSGNFGQVEQINITAGIASTLVYEPVDINNYVVVK